MSLMTIKVDDYLSKEEIKEIAIDELKESFRDQFRKETDIERVLSNLSHEYVFHRVMQHLEINSEDVEKIIIDGVAKALEPDTIRWKVFQRKDAWERTESPAVRILDDVLKDCRPKIEEMVNANIEKYDFKELRDEIEDTIYACICRKLSE